MLIRPFHSPSTSTESTSRSDVIAGLLWRCSWIRCSSVCIWRTISTTCCENYKTLTLDTFWLSLVVKHVNMLSSSRSLKCECMRIARANSTDFQESNSLGVSLHNIKEVYQPTGLQPERGNLAIPRPSKFSKTFWKRLKCFSCYAKQQVAIVLLSPEIFSWLRPWQQTGKSEKPLLTTIWSRTHSRPSFNRYIFESGSQASAFFKTTQAITMQTAKLTLALKYEHARHFRRSLSLSTFISLRSASLRLSSNECKNCNISK